MDRSSKTFASHCPLFSVLPEEQIAGLITDGGGETYKSGDILFRKGDPAERFFVVVEGHVVLYLLDEDDLSSIARIVGPGETFAEAAICSQGTYPVTAEVLGPAKIIAIPGEPFCRLLEDRFDLVLGMLSTMSIQLRGLIRMIMDLKTKTSAQRLAGYLLSLTDAESGSAEISLPYGKKILANELGMQPETLSRAFLKIQPLGVRYHKAGNVIRIGDVTALGEFCESVRSLPGP